MSGIFPSMIDQADPVRGLPRTGSFAADTKYPLRAGGTAAARKRKNALPSLLYMYHYIYARSGKRKRSVCGPRETELTLRGKRRKPSPGALAHAAQRAARAMRRPGDGSGENAGQGRAGFV